jgi:hypothetical protein
VGIYGHLRTEARKRTVFGSIRRNKKKQQQQTFRCHGFIVNQRCLKPMAISGISTESCNRRHCKHPVLAQRFQDIESENWSKDTSKCLNSSQMELAQPGNQRWILSLDLQVFGREGAKPAKPQVRQTMCTGRNYSQYRGHNSLTL